MKPVGDDLRAELRERFTRLSVRERLETALALGRRDVETYSRARCVDARAARRVLEATRHSGRRPSRSAQPDRD
ncbi:MAG TPA: hypothetical protein VMN82_14290 [Thermoanaerobaculia bacterium]|nr:hypothetical protein [Thermoanaerobaculia bacterium]